ncbi:Transaldolase [Truepera radiovictrix DSM 17093]|uniref:Transaldolase n=1 Tax=Truepera radiovictrix (strain DSM 17093 / CIP 108686 / LMG 22925 / RQ-24) TaxID=649638 RepID=D7CSI3_TRURR|nr:Transaldolase [Truepera radiovictrix DSM 17093]
MYLDSADLEVLRGVLPNPLVYGVTTNPTLMRRAGLAYADLPGFAAAVQGLGARAVHLQVPCSSAEKTLEAGRELAALGPPGFVVVKIPATREGFSGAAALVAEGVPVTMTAVYRPEQALWSQMVGAAYAAPYLGRLEDAGEDGLGLIGRMQRLLARYAGAHPTRLLVASVRTREAVLALLELGVGALTLPPALFTELTNDAETARAAETFLEDARALMNAHDT